MYIITEFMRHAAQCTHFPPQSAMYFLCYLIHKIFTFYIMGVLKLKSENSSSRG